MPTLDLFPIIKDKPIGQLDTEDFETTAYLSEYNKEDIELIRNLWAIRVNILLEEIESYGVTFNSFEEIMEKPNYVWHNFTKYDMSLGEDDKVTKESALYRNETLIEGIAYHLGSGLFGDFVVPPEIMQFLREEYAGDRIPDSQINWSKEYFIAAKELAEEFKRLAPNWSTELIISLLGAMHAEGGIRGYMKDSAVINTREASGNTSSTYAGGIKNAGEGWFQFTNIATKLKCCRLLKAKYGSPPGWPDTLTEANYNQHIAKLPKEWQIKLCVVYVEASSKWKDMSSDDNVKVLLGSYFFKAGPAYDSTMEALRLKSARSRAFFAKPENGGDPNHVNVFCKQICQAILFAQFIKGDKGDDPKKFDTPWKQ